MTDVKAALKTLGWRVDTAPRLRQSVEDFQRAWNLGPALAADGNAGPKTVAALNVSLASKAAGRGDISANFNASEFACECDGAWSDCRRIWVHRAVVKIAEQYRGLVGPFSPDRGCRCPRENARVGGVNNSQHLYGLALDLPLYAITSGQVQQLGTVSGIGVYLWAGRRYVRHVDARHLRGSSNTPSRPAQWDYGTAKTAPLTPAPVTATQPAPTPTQPAPVAVPASEEDDLMALQVKNPDTGELWDADRALWSIWTYTLKASRDASAALAVSRAAALSGRPLTVAETKQAVADALSAEYDAEVTLTPKETP